MNKISINQASNALAKKILQAGLTLTLALLLACQKPVPPPDPNLSADNIARLIPNRINKQQKMAWATDMRQIIQAFDQTADAKTVCSVIAVIDQESNFAADPAVPNLGKTSLKALEEKLETKLGKTMAGYFRNMLNEKPTPENSFAKQIKAVKTERQLDELFREMFAYFGDTYKIGLINKTAKLLNSGIDEKLNPITTLGSMQVHIDYAKAHRRTHMSDDELRADLYSRFGGMYYGIHRLLTYDAAYDQPIYRFADYNSGMYSSRNAAFQQWVSTLGKSQLDLDGDLLLYDGTTPLAKQSQSELALVQLAQQNTPINTSAGEATPLTPEQIRMDLKKEKSANFETTKTYQSVRRWYEEHTGKPAPYAVMPQVVIKGPKLKKQYDTAWYAGNVNKRYQTCIAAAKKHGLTKNHANK